MVFFFVSNRKFRDKKCQICVILLLLFFSYATKFHSIYNLKKPSRPNPTVAANELDVNALFKKLRYNFCYFGNSRNSRRSFLNKLKYKHNNQIRLKNHQNKWIWQYRAYLKPVMFLYFSDFVILFVILWFFVDERNTESSCSSDNWT